MFNRKTNISLLKTLYDKGSYLNILKNTHDKNLDNERKEIEFNSLTNILTNQVNQLSISKNNELHNVANLNLNNEQIFTNKVEKQYFLRRQVSSRFLLYLKSYFNYQNEKEQFENNFIKGNKLKFSTILFMCIVFVLYYDYPDAIIANYQRILLSEGFLHRDYRLDDEKEFVTSGEKEFNLKNYGKSAIEKITEEKDSAAAYNIIKPMGTSEFQIATSIKDRLSDVKGINEIKDEINDIVKMLKNPGEYEEAGAKLVKGILLMGKPGTGKTLLARALAGESGVNYIYCNGADFDKAYVGQGNNVVKSLFKQARENQPCIIFIDEIDSLLHKGRRSGKYSSSNDRSLINTFLSEMDGFKQREYVFVLGATNSEKDLDSASIRPGRFDKLINVPLPDSKGREEIFNYYMNKIQLKISDDVSSQYLSKLTPGFSGAEIENLVNHAIIEAVDKDLDPMTKDVFEEARDRVLTGIKRKINKLTLNKLIQTAVHESGHALTCYLDPICRENIHKISIIPRGSNASKSYSLSNDSIQGTKEEMYSFIDKSLGGLFAEEIFFQDKSKVSTGCGGGDLDRATNLAKSMIKNYGMKGTEFGLQVINDSNYKVDHKISEQTRDKLDSVVLSLINERSVIVKSKLSENSDKLKLLAKNLIQYEELTKADLDLLFDGKSLINKPKKNTEVLKYMEDQSKNKLI